MGYMIVDNRAAGGEVIECDTTQCPHCQKHLRKALRKETRLQTRGAWCPRCSKAVCDEPPCNTGCTPFLRAIEKAMSSAAFARDAGLQEG